MNAIHTTEYNMNGSMGCCSQTHPSPLSALPLSGNALSPSSEWPPAPLFRPPCHQVQTCLPQSGDLHQFKWPLGSVSGSFICSKVHMFTCSNVAPNVLMKDFSARLWYGNKLQFLKDRLTAALKDILWPKAHRQCISLCAPFAKVELPALCQMQAAAFIGSCHICWIKPDLLFKLTMLHPCTCSYLCFSPCISRCLIWIPPTFITSFPALINTSHYDWPLQRKKHSMRPIIRAEKHSPKLARVICVSCQFHSMVVFLLACAQSPVFKDYLSTGTSLFSVRG